MQKFKCFVLLSILLFTVNLSLSADHLHAIIVTDCRNELKEVTTPDLYHIQGAVEKIAKNTDLTLKKKVITGKDFKKQNLLYHLNQLKVGSQDVVIFYFSGHGYRTYSKQTHWPTLLFNWQEDGIDLAWIAGQIEGKKPRFALIIADCCNNFVEDGFDMKEPNQYYNFKSYAPSKKGYWELFRRQTGMVILASSSPGQFSFGCDTGGVCTNCLIMKLSEESYAKTPSWRKILGGVASHISKIQKPIFFISQ